MMRKKKSCEDYRKSDVIPSVSFRFSSEWKSDHGDGIVGGDRCWGLTSSKTTTTLMCICQPGPKRSRAKREKMVQTVREDRGNMCVLCSRDGFEIYFHGTKACSFRRWNCIAKRRSIIKQATHKQHAPPPMVWYSTEPAASLPSYHTLLH